MCIRDRAKLAKGKKTVTAFLDGDRGGKLLLMEISGELGNSLTHVAFAPTSREVEHLEMKVVTKSLAQKETAGKVVARIQKEIKIDDDRSVGRGQEALETPDEIKAWAGMLEGLKRNQAIVVNEDGTGSDPIGAKDLKETLADTTGAQGLVFAGKVTARILSLIHI